MKYKVNDIFFSLQGEGYLTGCSAIFIRFAGCNLKCPFCDTEFESYHEFSADYICTELLAHCIDHGVIDNPPMVVLTGGEPTLQVDEVFVDMLHEEGFKLVAMESNGLLPAPLNIDWLTVSPKAARTRRTPAAAKSATPAKAKTVALHPRRPDEIKIVFDGKNDPEKILADYKKRVGGGLDGDDEPLLFLQPCDTGDAARNAFITAACVEYVKRSPKWRLSLQTHKLIGIE